jgi:Arc/MetJ-type ribon-helix-helix transcriptional regulator
VPRHLGPNPLADDVLNLSDKFAFCRTFVGQSGVPRKRLPHSRRSRLDLRLEADLLERIEARVKEKGYRSAGEYVRTVVRRDLGGSSDAERLDLERMAAAIQNRILGSLRKVHVVQRAIYALLDASIKASLTYLPDPTSAELARARGKERYDRVVRAAETTSTELLDRLIAQLERESAKGTTASDDVASPHEQAAPTRSRTRRG